MGQSPTSSPTSDPSVHPTSEPTLTPTVDPSENPTYGPSFDPTQHPTMNPSPNPSAHPSVSPSVNPSAQPTDHSTSAPTSNSSANPSSTPTIGSLASVGTDASDAGGLSIWAIVLLLPFGIAGLAISAYFMWPPAAEKNLPVNEKSAGTISIVIGEAESRTPIENMEQLWEN